MRITRSVSFLFLLICGSLALEIASANAFPAGDVLEGTTWSDSELDFNFQKDGKLMVDDDECCGTPGTYRVNGTSVEMALDDGARASAIISGNSMTVKLTFEGKTEAHVLAKRMPKSSSAPGSQLL